MAFTLIAANTAPENFDDEAKYQFNEHNMLVITKGDGTRRTYSPAGWTYIEDKKPTGEGRRRATATVLA